ncbi:MAG: hypothetical protein VKP62_09340 [Candidatus Sericytochromatia bacterium]|nr:hypothetical protein [Candidatus Sericytochromatia bacterium]
MQRRQSTPGLLARASLTLALLASCASEVSPCIVSADRPAPGVLMGGMARIPARLAVAGSTASLEYEVPINRGEVFLSDASGAPLPGRIALTGPNGAYQLAGIPPGQAFGVVVVARTADGRDVQMRTLARTNVHGATADVDTASTLATVGLTEGISGPVGEFDRGSFERLVAMIDARLPQVASLDFTDPTALQDRFKLWYSNEAELRTLVDRLRLEIGRPLRSLDEQSRTMLLAQGLPTAIPKLALPASTTPATPLPSAAAGAGATPSSPSVPPPATPAAGAATATPALSISPPASPAPSNVASASPSASPTLRP